MVDDDGPMTPEELAEATAFAQSLEGGARDRTSTEDLAAVGILRAGAEREAPLGELRARAIARAALAEVLMQRSRRRRRGWLISGVAMAAMALIGLRSIGIRSSPRSEIPLHLASRSAGLLVPGPFPDSQTPAERLDVVTADRLIAFRELRVRTVAGRVH